MKFPEMLEAIRLIYQGYELLAVDAQREIDEHMGFDLGSRLRALLPEYGGKGQLELTERRKQIFRG